MQQSTEITDKTASTTRPGKKWEAWGALLVIGSFIAGMCGTGEITNYTFWAGIIVFIIGRFK